MTTITDGTQLAERKEISARLRDPVFQAFTLLRIGFTVAPILFGLDKFVDWLIDWDGYLAPGSTTSSPATATRRC